MELRDNIYRGQIWEFLTYTKSELSQRRSWIDFNHRKTGHSLSIIYVYKN